MKIIKTPLSCVCMALAMGVSLKAEGWRGIVPLRSTRVDVERLLGPSTGRCRCKYNLGNERVFIQYSGESCGKEKPRGWNVPSDTAITISVYFEKKPRFSDLQVDTTKFKKTEDPELRGYITYTNEEVGVTYEVSDKSIVQGIHYFPAAKDKHLRCPASATAEAQTSADAKAGEGAL